VGNLGIKKWDTEVSHLQSVPLCDFLSGRVGIAHEPIHCVARGEGYYELQSTTFVYGILLISQRLSTMHCFKSKCC